jgi:hypothetical protein
MNQQPAVKRMGGRFGEGSAEKRSGHDVAGIVNASVDAGIRDQCRERPEGAAAAGET